MKIAKLDENGVLIGTIKRAKPRKGDVDCGDLPTDGKYFWNGDTFIPVGFGQGKPKPPAVSRDRAVYLMMRAAIDGTPVPQECSIWCDWYERFSR